MSKIDEPLFPPEWGWQRYEDAIREDVAIQVRLSHQRSQLSRDEWEAEFRKYYAWQANLILSDLLPILFFDCPDMHLYGRILRQLNVSTMIAYRNGELSRGHAHQTADLSIIEKMEFRGWNRTLTCEEIITPDKPILDEPTERAIPGAAEGD